MLATLTVNCGGVIVHTRKKSRSPNALAKPFSEEKSLVTAVPLLAPSSPVSPIIPIAPVSPSAPSVPPSPPSTTSSSSSSTFFSKSSVYSTRYKTEIPPLLEAAQQALDEYKLEEACRIYKEEILTRDPTQQTALYKYAQALVLLGRKSEAIENYQVLLKYSAYSYRRQATSKLIALLYSEKKFGEAEQYWRQLTIQPFAALSNFKDTENTDLTILTVQGETLLALGKHEKAQKYRTRIFSLLRSSNPNLDSLNSEQLDALAFVTEKTLLPPKKSCCRMLCFGC